MQVHNHKSDRVLKNKELSLLPLNSLQIAGTLALGASDICYFIAILVVVSRAWLESCCAVGSGSGRSRVLYVCCCSCKRIDRGVM